jgi:ribosome assembly protein 4
MSFATEEKRTVVGGIAWAGSLVGSAQNPNNLGFRNNPSWKRYKRDEKEDKHHQFPDNIIIQLQNRQGEELANNLDLPTSSSIDDLSALVHSLLNDNNNNDKSMGIIPYSVYAKITKNGVEDDVEVTTTLLDLLKQHSLSTEHTLQLTYQPLAVFRCRPVSRCTDTMPGHTEAILHLSFSPDGKLLASGGGDTTVRFWDVHATNLPKFNKPCIGHKNHVLCTAWSPCGSRFVSADKNGVLIVWDPTTGKSIFTKRAHLRWITSMAFEPIHQNALGERLATSSRDGTTKIWNLRTQQCLATLSGHADSVECVKWGGQGLIYTASRDRTIKVWTAQKGDDNNNNNNNGDDLGKLVRTLKGHGHRINTLALSCDYVCRTGPFDHRGRIYESLIQDKQQAAKKRYDEMMGGEPERLVSGSDDYTLFLWHPTIDKHPIKRMTGHQQAVNHIAFSPDGRYFASASFDKKIKIWSGKSGDFLTTLTGHVGAVYQVAWSPDSRYLVSASKDSTAKLWEIPASGARHDARETLPGHADEVYALDWSPNGASVATGSKDRTIKIWKH